MFSDLEIEALYHYVSLKENQTRTSLPCPQSMLSLDDFLFP